MLACSIIIWWQNKFENYKDIYILIYLITGNFLRLCWECCKLWHMHMILILCKTWKSSKFKSHLVIKVSYKGLRTCCTREVLFICECWYYPTNVVGKIDANSYNSSNQDYHIIRVVFSALGKKQRIRRKCNSVFAIRYFLVLF